MSETRKSSRGIPLRCACGSTFAEIREDGTLVIVSRHHGHKCVNVLTPEQVAKLQQEVAGES